MDKPEEQELVKRAVAGDAAAFSVLLDGQYMIIYRTAYKWCGNREDAEDVAQDVCVKIGASLSKFRMDSKFSTWVYRITVNTANDLLRKKAMVNTAFSPDSDPDLVCDDTQDPEKQCQGQQLWQKVATLPQKQRDAVMLVYGEEKSHLETARIMDCKESTVSWYIHEARKALGKIYKR